MLQSTAENKHIIMILESNYTIKYYSMCLLQIKNLLYLLQKTFPLGILTAPITLYTMSENYTRSIHKSK